MGIVSPSPWAFRQFMLSRRLKKEELTERIPYGQTFETEQSAIERHIPDILSILAESAFLLYRKWFSTVYIVAFLRFITRINARPRPRKPGLPNR
jgi:hypothetical protein